VAALVHQAGPVVAAQQRCTRCGYMLEDYAGQRVMVIEGSGPGLPFWPEGASVIVDGNAAAVVTGDDDGHLHCKPVS
jgi:hypothetical protein